MQGYSDGSGTFAMFNYIGGIASDSNGNMFVADTNNNRIRKVALASGHVSTLAGGWGYGSADGIGSNAIFMSPTVIAADSSGFVYLAESGNGCRIRQIAVTTGNVSTLAGSGACGFADGVGSVAMFGYSQGIAADQSGNVFVADSGNCRIRQISVSTRAVSTLVGSFNNAGYSSSCSSSVDGVGSNAQFSNPSRLVADMQGSLFVVDSGTCRIRKIVIASRVVSTLAGSHCNGLQVDGVGSNAAFSYIFSFAADSFGSLFVAEQNSRIRHIDIATARVTTIAYSGSTLAMAVDLGALYLVDAQPFRIIKLEAITPCTAGFYCPSNGTAARVACEPGTFCPQGSSSAAGGGVCQAGSFCPRGSSAPVPCTAGAFCSESGLSAPSGNCTGGVYCPIGSSNQTGSGLCPAGLYCPSSSPAQACTAGYYCSAVGASAEARDGPCAIGAFCPAGSSSATQQPCTAGSFCNATGLSAAAGPCLAGYWCGAGSNSSTQNECAAGSYCVAGSSAPVLCPAGAYCAYAARGSFELVSVGDVLPVGWSDCAV
jgi:hypothetical protein